MGILSWLSGKFFDPKPPECVHDWEVVDKVYSSELAKGLALEMYESDDVSYAQAYSIAYDEMPCAMHRKVCIKCNCSVDETTEAIRSAKEKILHAAWRQRVASEVWANRNK